LAENHRLYTIPEIATIFEELRKEAEKSVQAQIISAYPITDAQRNSIAKGLKAKLNRDVVLECAVDESLISGAIIRAGDLVIDGSARGQLAKLATTLRQ
jgi:F-type H+-transporting ATPase subunit delta